MITVNGVELKPTIFPDKTSQVWKIEQEFFGPVYIKWDFESEAEIFHLMQLVTLIREGNHSHVINLDVPYFPYARQDKKVSNFSTFSKKIFTEILNDLELDEITCVDIHSSEYSPWNLKISYPKKEVYKVFFGEKHDIVCYPDKGALEKYSKIYDDLNYVHGEKVRDELTGLIKEYKLSESSPSFLNKKILIVDDICDGGATFIFLTKALKEAGAKEINLFVSHGIFSKGTQVLRDAGINKIFTKNGEVK